MHTPNDAPGGPQQPSRRQRDARSEFTHRAMIVIALVLVALLLVALIANAADVLLILFGGILLAVLLRGLADLLTLHTPLPEKVSLALVVALFLLIIAGGTWLLAAEISNQLAQLGTDITRMWQQIEERLRQETWGRQLLTQITRAQSDSPEASVAARVAQAFSTTLGALLNVAIVVIIGIYIAANPGWYRRGVLRLVLPAQRRRAQEILSSIGHTLRWWLFGRLVGMAIVGTATTLGLWLLDVPLALALGFLAAALDFVPNIGPIIAAAPGILVALGNGPTDAMYVALLYLGIQFLEGYVLTPLIEQRSVRLPPALTIGAQVLLGVLVGALGVVFATPLTAALVVLIKRLYVEDTLEHRTEAREHR